MKLRFLSQTFGLLLVVVALAFSGCAANDGYSPISGSSVNAGYGGFGGGGGG